MEPGAPASTEATKASENAQAHVAAMEGGMMEVRCAVGIRALKTPHKDGSLSSGASEAGKKGRRLFRDCTHR